MLGFVQPVAFSRVADKNSIYSDILEGYVILLRLGYRYVGIVLAVHQHRGSVNVCDMLERGTFPCLVHQPSLVQELAKFHLFILVVVSHVVVTYEVGNTGNRDTSPDLVHLPDHPHPNLPALTS